MLDNSNNNCPLCQSQSVVFYQQIKQLFLQCTNCKGIFVDQSLLPSLLEEKTRYETHNNDVNDLGYQKFVSPITSAIIANHNENDIGLDFGAGTGPVISKVLGDNNYQIKQYDPIFFKSPDLLETKYNYIACCEVIEHFHSPLIEFKLLKSLLKPVGKLYCMTHLYDEKIDFSNWYYKNDPTHVFIYQIETLDWIKSRFKFRIVIVDNRLITFNN